ncbi:YHS domain-containing protein [Mariprofundus ferrooxydans]|uniref:Putative metal ion permease n=1 Tax=Mariprofundus ferrooxydans PV-1 TaxID=314345 RepID=Q0F1K3_9PROT|nr:YHS domain-containing protein [Mariprofundus ferrooxydans]EAU55188.1 putative metal ion permease [Mariprofundus ferrooxydans PV-1]
MEGLGSLIVFALLFYVMMRFGCGAHMVHGHGDHAVKNDTAQGKFIDPVCGREVDPKKGYGVMHEGNLYRFCSRKCLDQFDGQPTLFINKHISQADHEHQS